MSIIIRPESTADQEAIRHVNRLAFGQDGEARLVDALRDGGYVRVSLVAEQGGPGRRPYPLQRFADHHRGRDGAGAGPRPDGGLAQIPEPGDRLGARAERAGSLPVAGAPDRRRAGPHAFLPTVRVFAEAGCAPGVAVFGRRLIHGGGVGAWGAGRRGRSGAVPTAVRSLDVTPLAVCSGKGSESCPFIT